MTERRLGLRAIYRDHAATWTERTGPDGKADRRRAWGWYFGVPTLLAAPLLFWHLEVHGLGQLLAGVGVFAALLFGVLILMFNTGVTLRKDADAISNAHGLRQLVGDVRANATWAVLISFAIAIALIVAAAITRPNGGAHWLFAPVIVWLFTHLGLTLLTILRRLRTAFNCITR